VHSDSGGEHSRDRELQRRRDGGGRSSTRLMAATTASCGPSRQIRWGRVVASPIPSICSEWRRSGTSQPLAPSEAGTLTRTSRTSRARRGENRACSHHAPLPYWDRTLLRVRACEPRKKLTSLDQLYVLLRSMTFVLGQLITLIWYDVGRSRLLPTLYRPDSSVQANTPIPFDCK